jgi:nucleoside-diphosphate-sugar epimerase
MGYVLVTGATGLVGSNLCKTLVEKGYKVKALVRESSDKSFLNTLNIDYVYADLRNLEKLKEALKGIEKVFHCAAQVGVLETFDHDHASTNIQGTRNLLEASVFNHVRKFIYVSTLGVLGILKDHYNDKEDSPYIKVGNPYYDTKIDAERLVLNYYNDKNLPVVVLRPGFIYGPRDRNGLPNLMPYLLRRKIVYVGSGNNDIALTSVKNLVSSMILAAEKEEAEGNVYNITDDQGITANQFLKELCNILQIPEPRIHLPIPVAASLARTVEGVSRLLDKDSQLNEYTVALISNNHHFDVSKARNELGYTPSENFSEDLKEAISWYLENHSKEIKKAEKSVKITKLTIASSMVAVAALGLLYIRNKSRTNEAL